MPHTTTVTFTADSGEDIDTIQQNSPFPVGPVFILVVGAEQVTMSACSSVLSKSPVFERMVNGPFKEAQQKVIELPEDNPVLIDHLLKFLNGDDIMPEVDSTLELFRLAVGDEDYCQYLTQLLGDVYILADKYDVPPLQHYAVSKMKDLIALEPNYDRFIKLAKQIYAEVYRIDDHFREFFQSEIAEVQDQSTGEIPEVIRSCLSFGGSMAEDTYLAKYRALQGGSRSCQPAVTAHCFELRF